MKAAYYTKNGTQAAVLHVGIIDDIEPGRGEVQVEIFYSGINPGEISKGVLQPGTPMPYPFIIPHSDGAGIVRKVGSDVSSSWIGKKVLCFSAQSYRAFGTAAEFCSLPLANVVELTEHTPLLQAAQMGIPAMTGYMSIFSGGDPGNRTILVQGGAGAVGQCAIQFARRGGATVLATVTQSEDMSTAEKAGASAVFVINSEIISAIKNNYPDGIDHISEVSLAKNIATDIELLKNRGSIGIYSSTSGSPEIPFWQLVFNNISLYFLGSDDFSLDEKRTALKAAVNALDAGWPGLEITEVFPLDKIVDAHQFIANRTSSKRVVLDLKK